MRNKLLLQAALALTLLFIPAAIAAPLTAAQSASIPERISGSPSAPITIELFSDLQCPFCRELHLRTMTRVLDDYCKKGQVKIVHRDLINHRYSKDATRWAIACATIGKYDAIAELLFQEQAAWGADGKIEAIIARALTTQQLQKVKQVMATQLPAIDDAINNDILLA